MNRLASRSRRTRCLSDSPTYQARVPCTPCRWRTRHWQWRPTRSFCLAVWGTRSSSYEGESTGRWNSCALAGRRAGLHPVVDSLDARLFSAMGAAVELAAALDAMADDLASAVRAGRSQSVDGALKCVERMRSPGHRNLERLVV